MKWLAALAVCCGCDVLFRLDDVRVVPDTTAGPTADAARHCVRDSFDAIDEAVWNIKAPASPVAVAANGQLRISLAARLPDDNFNGLVTDELFDLKDATVTIELVQAATQEANVATRFSIGAADAADFYMFEVSADKIQGYVIENGATVSGTAMFGYVPAQIRFLQFRHLDSRHELEMRMGATPDASSLVLPVADAVAVGSMFISITAGTRGTGSATPGQAMFDNFTLALPGCMP